MNIPTAESMNDLCVCGHERLGHHPLCNGQVGKFWCVCKTFKAREESA